MAAGNIVHRDVEHSSQLILVCANCYRSKFSRMVLFDYSLGFQLDLLLQQLAQARMRRLLSSVE